MELETVPGAKVHPILRVAVPDNSLLRPDLYLPAFGPLRQAYKPSELNRWGELMVERGVRLRQELDVFTGAHEDDSRDEELPAIEPDIEYNASELRRLMPY